MLQTLLTHPHVYKSMYDTCICTYIYLSMVFLFRDLLLIWNIEFHLFTSLSVVLRPSQEYFSFLATSKLMVREKETEGASMRVDLNSQRSYS